MVIKFLNSIKSAVLLLIILLQSATIVQSQNFSLNNYHQSIEEWHKSRVEQLKTENGWLNLAGLFWLKQGKNTFGTGTFNNIIFPKGTINEQAGYFQLTDSAVWLVTSKGTSVTLKSVPVQKTIIYYKDSAGSPSLASGSLRFTVIRREDKIGIRLRDLKNEALIKFKGIDRFTVDTAWRLTAKFQPAGFISTIAITNVLGQTTQQQSPGKLIFFIKGVQYSLDALEEDGELFIIFADETNAIETYPSGRFLLVQKPDANGNTIIDFNKAYNPPCAFTPFATCPLPPKQNVLPIAVTAGEKNFGEYQ